MRSVRRHRRLVPAAGWYFGGARWLGSLRLGALNILGRRRECNALDQLLVEARADGARVLVLRGDAGVGKSALLTYLRHQAAGGRCTAAGLTLFAEAAEQGPLLCMVDDVQWLDQVSAKILSFVGRRLLGERVAVIAARTGIGDKVFMVLLGKTRVRADLARAQLLYGEWLRRANRRRKGRRQLNLASEMFTEMGLLVFLERSHRELLATDATVRKRRVESQLDLTVQETQIARLARDGLSNPEIGAQLFICARTVEWHLRKVLVKTGISSCRQLRELRLDAGQVLAGAP